MMSGRCTLWVTCCPFLVVGFPSARCPQLTTSLSIESMHGRYARPVATITSLGSKPECCSHCALESKHVFVAGRCLICHASVFQGVCENRKEHAAPRWLLKFPGPKQAAWIMVRQQEDCAILVSRGSSVICMEVPVAVGTEIERLPRAQQSFCATRRELVKCAMQPPSLCIT